MATLQGLIAFMNGMIAGCSQVFVMQPFEIIKIRLQTQSENAKVYNGIIDCLGKIIKQEGPLALWKGSLTPLMGVGLLGSSRFGFYQYGQKQIASFKNKQLSDLAIVDKTIAGLFGGFMSSFLLCIIEHTRIRIQIQKAGAQKVYTGSLDALIKILRQYGPRGLWRGLGPSMVRQSTGLASLFTTSQIIYKLVTPPEVTNRKELPMYITLFAGGIGGITYWVLNYPFDYVKTLMQSDKLGDYKYSSMVDCFRKEYAQNGLKTFYKGYLICMLRSFPVNAALLVTYRVMQSITGVTSH